MLNMSIDVRQAGCVYVKARGDRALIIYVLSVFSLRPGSQEGVLGGGVENRRNYVAWYMRKLKVIENVKS